MKDIHSHNIIKDRERKKEKGKKVSERKREELKDG